MALFAPLQTWEGFVGAFFFTCVFAFYFSGFLAKFDWFTCPVQELNFRPKPIHCKADALFLPAEFVVVRDRETTTEERAFMLAAAFCPALLRSWHRKSRQYC